MEVGSQRHKHTSISDIVTLLARVTRSHKPLSVRAGAEAFLATIESVHLLQPHLLMRCDASGQLLACALQHEALHFAANLESARLEFSAAARYLPSQDGERKIRVDLPAQLFRFDRRSHLRGKLPRDVGASCEAWNGARLLRMFAVQDISAGGVGLISSESATDFTVGKILRGCLVRLPGMDPFTVDLEVRCLREDRDADQGPLLRLGCRFLDLNITAAEAVARFAAYCD